MSRGACSVGGCEQPAYVGGRCRSHYLAAMHQKGSPLYRRPTLCTVDGCKNPHSANGLCEAHYARKRRYGRPDYQPPLINGGPCSVDGCERTARALGLCEAHFRRQHKTGDPSPGKPVLTPEQVKYIQQQKGIIPVSDLANECNTTVRAVIAIQAGRSWGFLKS